MIKYIRHRCNSFQQIAEHASTYDGLECDVWLGRDGTLVQHHPGEVPFPIPLENWLMLADNEIDWDLRTYAINVKTNGLANFLHPILRNRKDYFLFDVPGEEIEEYANLGLRIFARWSEYDYQQGYLHDLAGGVIDCFKGDYTLFPTLLDNLLQETEVAMIGEDLRGRLPLPVSTLEKLRVKYLITKVPKP